MEDLEKVSEALVVKVRALLMRQAEAEVAAADEPDLLTDAEVQAFVDRTLNELALDTRVRLHAQAWVSDVREYARQLARKAINNKIKKAASAGRAAGAGREF